MPSTLIQDYMGYWQDELDSATLYREVSETERNPKLANVYRRLAQTEQRHAEVWAEQIRAKGGSVPAFRPSWRARILCQLARRFGTAMVLPSLATREQTGLQTYKHQPDAQALLADEHSHSRLLRQIGQTMRGGMEGGLLAELEGRHRTAGGNALRAAILGANDGLVSNLSLVMGVAGAELAGGSIIVTGLAGLLAGAISMALGEWISVQSSRELYEKQIRTEKEEIANAPEEEVEELTLIYEARGLEQAAAHQLAQRVMADQANALETLARDELGINPEELGGSAWEAAITSFSLFAVGAIIPVLPFIFFNGFTAVTVSAMFSAVGLFVSGAAITLFTGRSVWSAGMRQVLFGLAAAAITYAIGRLVGVGVGG